MSEVSISVFRDPETCPNGEAVLRLTGVALVPPGSTYRIDPVGGDGLAGPPEGWPSGELKPCAQKIIRDGVELVIGADVVDAKALRPGTPVTISVPAVGARANLLWPSLREERSPTAESIAATAQEPAEHASELAIRAAVTLAASSSADLLRLEAKPTANHTSDEEEAERRFVAAIARNLSDGGSLSSLALAPASPPVPRASPPPLREEALATLKPVSKLRPVSARETPPPKPPKPVPPKMPAVPLEVVVPPPPPTPAMRRPAPPPNSAADAATFNGGPPAWAHTAIAFALGFMLAAGAAVLLPRLAPRLAFQAPPPPAATETVVQRAAATRSAGLADILDVPTSSPRGETADNVSFEDALQRADQSLTGGAGPDRREAKFWLRKALSAGLGDERMQWALTQLGTIYASPDADAADFASARILWELAAAKGDPVALCFLASLHANGLGTQKNPGEALTLYQRAQARGGCPGIDDAIARLMKAAP